MSLRSIFKDNSCRQVGLTRSTINLVAKLERGYALHSASSKKTFPPIWAVCKFRKLVRKFLADRYTRRAVVITFYDEIEIDFFVLPGSTIKRNFVSVALPSYVAFKIKVTPEIRVSHLEENSGRLMISGIEEFVFHFLKDLWVCQEKRPQKVKNGFVKDHEFVGGHFAIFIVIHNGPKLFANLFNILLVLGLLKFLYVLEILGIQAFEVNGGLHT